MIQISNSRFVLFWYVICFYDGKQENGVKEWILSTVL